MLLSLIRLYISKVTSISKKWNYVNARTGKGREREFHFSPFPKYVSGYCCPTVTFRNSARSPGYGVSCVVYCSYKESAQRNCIANYNINIVSRNDGGANGFAQRIVITYILSAPSRCHHRRRLRRRVRVASPILRVASRYSGQEVASSSLMGFTSSGSRRDPWRICETWNDDICPNRLTNWIIIIIALTPCALTPSSTCYFKKRANRSLSRARN